MCKKLLRQRPCYTVHFFLQLAMQFYSWEMLISEISEEFSICWENISGVTDEVSTDMNLPSNCWLFCVNASTFIKLDFLFSSLFIALFPARDCKISWQISWHFLYLYLAFRSFPTISFTVTIHSLPKYDLKLKISANSVFYILESWDFCRFRIFGIFLQYIFFNRCPFELSLRAISEQFPNRTERFPKLIWRSK
jgi:hypothetical protein